MSMTASNDHRPPESAYLNCIRCGLCLAVCPTYREYLTETASPRGRVALARKGLEGELALSSNLFEQMYACFDCLACNEICPVGIRPADLALALRETQEALQPARWKRPLFRGLIPHPGRLELATLPLRLYERLGLRRLIYALGLRRFLPGRLADLEAMLPRLPQRPLRHHLPAIVYPADSSPCVEAHLPPAPFSLRFAGKEGGRGKKSSPLPVGEGPGVRSVVPVGEGPGARSQGPKGRRVGFFLGCAQNTLFAEESAATVRVLARNGCTVITPRETKCCGMPARGYGDGEAARGQARFNIALFERVDVDVIVTDCATCGSTLREYAALLADDPAWAGRAAAFSRKVRDVSEFLMSLPPEKPAGRIEARVTYHDPCHLRRGQGVWREPRALLQLIDGLEFVELPEADWCCGSAGSQLITHYETSLRVLDRKMTNLAATGAQIIASGCPGCQMQLITGARRRGLKIEVTHPIVLLDRAYRCE
ncbi:MAG: (Fe-S)-binding protein [Anaerolineae bacterium]